MWQEWLKKFIERLPRTEMYYLIVLIGLISISGYLLKIHDRLLILKLTRSEILIGFIIVGTLASYAITKLITGKKLRLLFGAYWDDKLNPYCTSCKAPIVAKGGTSCGDQFMVCVKCKEPFKLVHNDGKAIDLQYARDQLKKIIKGQPIDP